MGRVLLRPCRISLSSLLSTLLHSLISFVPFLSSFFFFFSRRLELRRGEKVEDEERKKERKKGSKGDDGKESARASENWGIGNG